MTGHCDKSVHTLLCKKNAIFSGIILRKDDWKRIGPTNDFIFLLNNQIGDLVARCSEIKE